MSLAASMLLVLATSLLGASCDGSAIGPRGPELTRVRTTAAHAADAGVEDQEDDFEQEGGEGVGIPLEHSPEELAARHAKVLELCEELGMPGRSSWLRLGGCPRKPTFPAAMEALGSRLYLVTEDRLERFELGTERWLDEPLALPAPAGTGVTLAHWEPAGLVFACGGDRPGLWALDPATESWSALPEPPVPVGRGGALASAGGELYLAPGRRTTDLLCLPTPEGAWTNVGPIGGDTPLETNFGRNAGFLAAVGDGLYGWPDHHTQKYNVATRQWDNGKGRATWFAMGIRPSLDGGGVGVDAAAGAAYLVGGMFSRAINVIVPDEKRMTFYVRPRAPYPMIGEGDRVTVAEHEGEPHLFVYAVEPHNELCAIPTGALHTVVQSDALADEGSPWFRLHSPGGGNGVRRRRDLGAAMDIEESQGTLGVLGALDGYLFLMRLAHVRRIEPRNGRITYYPGRTLGRPLALGAAGVHDGERYLYMTTGRSDYFLRWDLPTGLPEKKRMSYPRPSIHQTELDVLPPMPGEIGMGGALAHHGASVYALRGDDTRVFWRYVVAEERWEVLPPLPEEASAPGQLGAGLVANARGVFAVCQDVVWRYGPTDRPGARWERFAELPFAPHWDGGMVSGYGDDHLFVVRGDVSNRLGALDLGTRAFQELHPGPPDVISAEGNRLALLLVDGEARVYVHRGHNSNEVLWARLADLGFHAGTEPQAEPKRASTEAPAGD